MKLCLSLCLLVLLFWEQRALSNKTVDYFTRQKNRTKTAMDTFGSNRSTDDGPAGRQYFSPDAKTGKEDLSSLVCPKGTSKNVVEIDGCTNMDYRTQAGVFYRGPTKCHTIFKVKKEECLETEFTCSFSDIPNETRTCRRGDRLQVKEAGKTKKFCQKRSAKVSFKTSLKVSFIAGRKGKGKGAVCNVRCAKFVTPVCSRIMLEGIDNANIYPFFTYFMEIPGVKNEFGVWEATCQFHGGCSVYKHSKHDKYLYKSNSTTWITSPVVGGHEHNQTLRLTSDDCLIDESHNEDQEWDYYQPAWYSWSAFNGYENNTMSVTCV